MLRSIWTRLLRTDEQKVLKLEVLVHYMYQNFGWLTPVCSNDRRHFVTSTCALAPQHIEKSSRISLESNPENTSTSFTTTRATRLEVEPGTSSGIQDKSLDCAVFVGFDVECRKEVVGSKGHAFGCNKPTCVEVLWKEAAFVNGKYHLPAKKQSVRLLIGDYLAPT